MPFFDREKLAAAAYQASVAAREELLRKGIPIVYGRSGRIIKELPNGRKIVVGRLHNANRLRGVSKV